MPYKNKKDRAKAQARYRKKIEAVIKEVLTSGCLDCGEKDEIVLVFHHRDPKTKLFSVGRGRGKSIPVLLREIEKCDVLCANCHRRKHYARTW